MMSNLKKNCPTFMHCTQLEYLVYFKVCKLLCDIKCSGKPFQLSSSISRISSQRKKSHTYKSKIDQKISMHITLLHMGLEGQINPYKNHQIAIH